MSVLCLPPAMSPLLLYSVHVALLLAAAPAVTSQSQGAEPREVEIIKQINRVNEDGSYTFGYEAADGSFKIETRDVMGNVKGMFGFIDDETGELKKVSYTASNGTGFKATGERLPVYTTERPSEEEVTRRPVLVLRQSSDPTRPPVIQHIPRRGGYTTTSTGTTSTSTTPVYGEYLKGRRTHIVLPTRTETTTASPKVTEEPEDEPTQIPLRKLLTRKPPVQGKGGNTLRRQLGGEPDAPAGDAADVYSGGAASPRYIPVQSIRSPQSPLLANLPPHVAAAIRQQQIARAAATLRSYTPVDPYSTPAPLPDRPGVIDEQEYPPVPPVPVRRPLPPVKAVYRSPAEEDLPTQVPFPMSSLVSLRDELMDYILRYLQFRLAGGNPYLMNPYPPPYQSPVPNYPYPTNYPAANPNLFNPYYFPTNPYQRGVPPYQPPFPVGYPPVGYPGVGYPGSFPQPLPFSSPNKQQAGQGYGPSQRSAPNYESPRQNLRGYDSQSQVSRGSAATYEQAETRGASEQTSYSLPPSDVLRMMLARGLATSTTSTTAAPVRNVQILGAASSLSSSTLPPPEEMEMQA